MKKLLEWMSQDGMLTLTEVAGQLDVSEAALKRTVEELVQTGYLRRVDGCFKGPCSTCSLRRTCTLTRMGMWERTEKGAGGGVNGYC